MDISLLKHVRGTRWYSPLAGLGLAVAVLWIGFSGLHRSLWLDEAWVANSVREPSWGGMFWAGEWLQTTSPLFLIIARFAVAIGGLSVETLRAVPLLFAAVAGIAIYRAASRVAPALAPLACAALLFPQTAGETFGAFKQYGAEAAAVSIVLWATLAYLDQPTQKRFVILGASLIGLLPLAYPLAFVAPGIALAVYIGSPHRAVTLIGGFGAMLAVLYFFFIAPNVAPSLWGYWNGSAPELLPVAWLALSIVGTAWAAWRRNWTLLVCLFPCLLLLIAEFTGWYPASPRTRFFIRPCLILAMAVAAREVRIPRWAPAVLALALAANAIRMDPLKPVEDYTAVTRYLREHVQPQDLLLIHADAREGMRLAFAIAKWEPTVQYGSTGWPCCRRVNRSAGSTESEVRADLARLIPADFRGRVWLVYSNRALHWRYLGLDEGHLWRHVPWERGCPPAGYVDLTNVVISPADCNSP
jgi:hypothetical protein